MDLDGGDKMLNLLNKKKNKILPSQIDYREQEEHLERLFYGKAKTNNEQFEKDGYLVIRNLWDPKDLFCEVPYLRGDVHYYGKINKFSHDPTEQQVPGSLARYSYPPYKFYHSQIRFKIENAIGKKLFNTYYYDRFYFVGQELPRHIDRPACEISVTLHISTNTNECWPIWVKTPDIYDDMNKNPEDRVILRKGEERSICLNPGDCVIYKGCERPHWRNALPSRHGMIKRTLKKLLNKDDTYYHQVFFHYVLADGIYSHHAGDR